MDFLRQRAEKGDVQAQSELGSTYEFLKRDYAEALKWYRMAAEQGSTAAEHGLAEMYFEGKGVTKDYAEAARWYGCPKPSIQALATCKEIKYKDLPQQALDLLTQMKCDAGALWLGAAVDLDGDGEPEYELALVWWRHRGFANGCGSFIVLESRHDGFSDVCLPNQCSWIASASGKTCRPTIWQFTPGRYRSVENTPVTPSIGVEPILR